MRGSYVLRRGRQKRRTKDSYRLRLHRTGSLGSHHSSDVSYIIWRGCDRLVVFAKKLFDAEMRVGSKLVETPFSQFSAILILSLFETSLMAKPLSCLLFTDALPLKAAEPAEKGFEMLIAAAREAPSSFGSGECPI
ncbi:hypothetical protein [Parafrankia sp. BMG5.11]|uniref:hypothetical protein n=1 Tax=Parafrankia sp. BMG5.11 TaxID=222540 RepID=UPI00103A981C|nr:hypothetical protein [Parafrankia sp. BMG5.11]TCJ37388.1 hypothetical protein E0504_20345 [Parafrankia sp. BMG5.11]